MTLFVGLTVSLMLSRTRLNRLCVARRIRRTVLGRIVGQIVGLMLSSIRSWADIVMLVTPGALWLIDRYVASSLLSGMPSRLFIDGVRIPVLISRALP